MSDFTAACRDRLDALASALERRAHTCPGLFPVESACEFLSLAARTEKIPLPALSPVQIKALWLRLESYHRHPSHAVQDAGTALRSVRPAPPRLVSGDSAEEYNRLRRGLLLALSPLSTPTGAVPCPS